MGDREIGIKILKKCFHFCKIYSKKFRGLGFTIATRDVLKKQTLPLRPSAELKILKQVNNKCTTIDDMAQTLVKLATSKNFHDGFHFLDKKLNFVGICRILLIKRTKIKPNEKTGVRYYSAKIFSSYHNVKFVGVINSNMKAFYFIKGNEFLLRIK